MPNSIIPNISLKLLRTLQDGAYSLKFIAAECICIQAQSISVMRWHNSTKVGLLPIAYAGISFQRSAR